MKVYLASVFVSIVILLVGDYYVLDLGLLLGSPFGVVVDGVSGGFFFVGMLVSSAITIFSFWYMSEEISKYKFIGFMFVFLSFMFVLTFSHSLLMLLIGWEGVGLMSYLLISWWSGRSEAGSSALSAILYNRISDFGVYLGFFMLVLFSSGGFGFLSDFILNFLGVFFLMGVLAKSSQFFFHPWLPSAMEGPTPVSSLLHSSTMVVAGVFLIIRLFDLYSGVGLWLVFFMGSLTMLYGSASALGQVDAKKVVAYSTTSQLGLMMCAVGLGFNNLAFFHLCMHAFFKSMIFLTSGFFIHYKGVIQDARFLSGVQTGFSFVCLVLGSMALGGMPFLAGYYSKDLILENMYGGLTNRFMVLVICVASVMTVSYSFRLVSALGTFSVLLAKLSSLESLGAVRMLVRLLVMTCIGGLGFVLVTACGEEYLSGYLKVVPLCLVVSGILLGGSFDLGFFMFSHNPLFHRLVLGLFYRSVMVVQVVEFYLWEFFFSKFVLVGGGLVSISVIKIHNLSGMRVYIGFGIVVTIMLFLWTMGVSLNS